MWAGAALLDYDADGWLDIFLTNGLPQPDALYRNNGDGTFTDAAEAAGVASLQRSGAVTAGDLDNDGDTDLVVNIECSTGSYTSDGEPLLDGDKVVYLNNGDGTFSRRSIELAGELTDYDTDPRSRCTVSLALFDLNNDGILDLVSTNSHDPDTAPPWVFDKFHIGAESVVLFGDGDGNFSVFSEDLGAWGSFVSAHLDVDGDGLADLIEGTSGKSLATYRSHGDGTLSLEIDRGRKTGSGLWMGMALADFDGDLDLDIYATNQGLSPLMWGYDNLYEAWPGTVSTAPDFSSPGSSTPSAEGVNPFHSMLKNENGSFALDLDWSLTAPQLLAGDLFDGLEGRYMNWTAPQDLRRLAWGWGVVPLDVDADGWVDLAFTGNSCDAPMSIIWDEQSGAGPGGLLINNGGTGFVDVTWESGIANVDNEGRYVDGRGLVTGDLNNDGYPDLVVVNRTYNPSHTSSLAQEPGTPRVWLSRPRDGRWLQVDLNGVTSNRDGIGAMVTITDGQRTWLHGHALGGQTNSSSEHLLTVGVADAETVDIEVVFPGGQTASAQGVTTNQRITLTEGD